MKETGQPGTKHRLLPCREEIVYLDLLRTTDILSRPFADLWKTEDVSPTQYNVLRILRGARDGLTCSEIGARMITRDPDITRLLDRLEKRNLISRSRETKDRRVVLTRIEPEGLELLARLDEQVRDLHKQSLGHLGRDRLKTLTGLLEVIRTGPL